MTCHRCRKPLAMNGALVAVAIGTVADPSATTYYHVKCLPPLLFKKLGGVRTPAAVKYGQYFMSLPGRSRRPPVRHRLGVSPGPVSLPNRKGMQHAATQDHADEAPR